MAVFDDFNPTILHFLVRSIEDAVVATVGYKMIVDNEDKLNFPGFLHVCVDVQES